MAFSNEDDWWNRKTRLCDLLKGELTLDEYADLLADRNHDLTPEESAEMRRRTLISRGLISSQKDEQLIEDGLGTTEKDEQLIDDGLGTTEKDEQLIEDGLGTTEKDEQLIEDGLGTTEKDEQLNEDGLGTTEKDEQLNEDGLGTTERDEQLNEDGLGTTERDEQLNEDGLGTTENYEQQIEDTLKKITGAKLFLFDWMTAIYGFLFPFVTMKFGSENMGKCPANSYMPYLVYIIGGLSLLILGYVCWKTRSKNFYCLEQTERKVIEKFSALLACVWIFQLIQFFTTEVSFDSSANNYYNYSFHVFTIIMNTFAALCFNIGLGLWFYDPDFFNRTSSESNRSGYRVLPFESDSDSSISID